MNDSAKVSVGKLSAVPYTLMIPLVSRAKAQQLFPELGFSDPRAEETLSRIEEGDGGFGALPEIIYPIVNRTLAIRNCAQEFFARHPGAMGANIGCGLADYFQWLDTGKNQWVDADLSEVIELRKKLLRPKNERHVFKEISLTEEGWWKKVPIDSNQPALLVIEGVFLYLKPNQVQKIFSEFAEHFAPGSILVFDFIAWLAVGRAQSHHPALRLTRAEFRWGVRRTRELSQAHPDLELTKVLPMIRKNTLLDRFGARLFQRITGTPFYGIAQMTRR